jgi:hypothetical protein
MICLCFETRNEGHKYIFKRKESFMYMPWRRVTVDIASASGTRRPGFESRQVLRFLGKHSSADVYKIT